MDIFSSVTGSRRRPRDRTQGSGRPALIEAAFKKVGPEGTWEVFNADTQTRPPRRIYAGGRVWQENDHGFEQARACFTRGAAACFLYEKLQRATATPPLIISRLGPAHAGSRCCGTAA
jgi:hypothetical protein